MTTRARVNTHGELGRLPKRAEADRLALRWAHEYLVPGALPAPVYPINPEPVGAWGMAGNDVWGDCAQAALYHLWLSTALAASANGQGGPVPAPTEAVNLYENYTGATSPPGPGTTLASFLQWAYGQGLVLAFAPVELSDLAQCDALMAAGFGLYVGATLTPSALAEFDQGQTWGDTPTTPQPTPSLGHCLLRVGATGRRATDESTYVTWGELQDATRAWDVACTDEAWLIVTTEEQAALFEPELLADVAALGGTGGTPAPSS